MPEGETQVATFVKYYVDLRDGRTMTLRAAVTPDGKIAVLAAVEIYKRGRGLDGRLCDQHQATPKVTYYDAETLMNLPVMD